ncbi:MAG: S9 family peptidase [Pseudomonadota bacterium]
MILRTTLFAAACGALAASAAADDETDKRFTAERVFDLEFAADPQITPDGRTIVYVRRSMDRQKDVIRGDLWTVDTRTGAHRPLVDGGASVSAPRWSPDGTKLLYRSTTEDGEPELRILFRDTGDSLSLATFDNAPREAVWSPDGMSVAFTMFTPSEGPSFATPPKAPEGAEWAEPVRVFDDLQFRFDGAGFLEEGADHVYVLAWDGGVARQVTTGDGDFGGPAWLDTDTLLVVGNDAEDRELDPIESEIYAVELSDLSRTALTTRDGPDHSPKVSPKGNRIAFLGYDDEVLSYQHTRLYIMRPDGSEVQELTVGFDRSIDAIEWRDDGRLIFAQVENAGEIDIMSFSLEGDTGVMATGLGGVSIGRPYAAASFSVSKERRPTFAFTSGSPDRPSEVAVAGRDVNPSILTDLNGDVLPYLDLARIEEIEVPSSAGGLPIEAWVALPPDFEPNGTFPMLMEIHGGPYAMYGPFFAAEIQRFAAEGYVTVYVNPRGSTGYGEEFAQLIDLAYPGEDYDDLMSVVDALEAMNYVDPNRLFVTGGSGGGILTAWIVGQTDRFAAAASIKPVINWMTMALSADIAQIVRRHWIREDPWENPDAYLARSPISLIGNVTTPTLVMVGEEDWRTPAWEAEQFYTALKLRQVDTALIRIPGASHSIASRPSRLIAKTDNIMGWFANYDPGPRDPAETPAEPAAVAAVEPAPAGE